jgi:hypothetical protein
VERGTTERLVGAGVATVAALRQTVIDTYLPAPAIVRVEARSISVPRAAGAVGIEWRLPVQKDHPAGSSVLSHDRRARWCAHRLSLCAQLAERIPAYDVSPANFARKMLTDRTAQATGDPVKMVDRMIASVDVMPAPGRLVLGSDRTRRSKRS